MSVHRNHRTGNHKGKQIHEQHAAARALGFVRRDKRGMSPYPASFVKRCELEGEWELNKNKASEWQAVRSHNNWYTPWFSTPEQAWVYGCLNNWGQ